MSAAEALHRDVAQTYWIEDHSPLLKFYIRYSRAVAAIKHTEKKMRVLTCITLEDGQTRSLGYDSPVNTTGPVQSLSAAVNALPQMFANALEAPAAFHQRLLRHATDLRVQIFGRTFQSIFQTNYIVTCTVIW